jgi:hypothetical protein
MVELGPLPVIMPALAVAGRAIRAAAFTAVVAAAAHTVVVAVADTAAAVTGN